MHACIAQRCSFRAEISCSWLALQDGGGGGDDLEDEGGGDGDLQGGGGGDGDPQDGGGGDGDMPGEVASFSRHCGWNGGFHWMTNCRCCTEQRIPTVLGKAVNVKFDVAAAVIKG